MLPLVVLIAFSLPAAAQTPPLDRFVAASDGNGFATTESAEVPGHVEIHAGATGHFAWQPLVLRNRSGAVVVPIVQSRTTTDFTFSLGLFDAFSVHANLPVVLWQSGGDLGDLAPALGLEQGLAFAGIGDLRTGIKLRFLRRETHFVSLAFLADVTWPIAVGIGPSGPTLGGSFLGDGGIALVPGLALSTSLWHIEFAANVAYRARGIIEVTTPAGKALLQPEFIFRGGLGLKLDDVHAALPPAFIFAEIFGNVPDRFAFGVGEVNADKDRILQQIRLAHGLEWNVGARYPIGAFAIETGVGAGAIAGVGAPDIRITLGVRFSAK